MKKIINSILLFIILVMVNNCTNEDSIIDQVDNNVTRGAILRGISVAPLLFDLRYPDEIWSLEVEMEDNNGGKLLDFVNIYVSFIDNTPQNGNTEVPRQLIKTLNADDFINGVNDLPRGTLDLSFTDVLTALGLSEDDYEGGDVITIDLELNLTDGRVYTKDDVNGGIAGGSFFKSPFTYRLTVVGCPPRPGVYTIEMTDDYGDGWQTTNGDSGPGITVTADGVQIAEFGLCSIYDDTQDPWCTSGASSGSTTIEIPVGTESATWYFPGDFWGEIGFKVFGPEDELVFDSPAGSLGEGEFYVVLCRLD